MIKINKNISELDVLANNHLILLQREFNLIGTLNLKLVEYTGQAEEALFRKLLDTFEELIVGQPKKLQKLIGKIDPLYQDVLARRCKSVILPTKEKLKETREKWKNEIINIFCYNKFITSYKGKLAYDHANNLDVNVCLYCNTQYTFTIETKNGKTRPEFDHFYSKSKYPYLALSFYNLVPSCSVCNSSFKGTKPFEINTHFHPLIEGFNETLKISTDITSVDYLVGKKDFEIKFTEIGTKPNVIRARNNVNVFHLEEQFKFHKELVGDLIRLAYFYNETEIDALLEDFILPNGEKLFSSKQQILEVLFGTYLNDDKICKRPLSRMFADILSELKVKK